MTIVTVALLLILSPVILAAAYFALLFAVGIIAAVLFGLLILAVWALGCLDDAR